MGREAPNSFSCSRGRLRSSRSGLRRTFGGMLACTAFFQLGFGAYLIEDQFANPLTSNPAGLFFAAAMVACGLVLMSYLIHPGLRHEPKVLASQILDIPGNGPAIEVTARESHEAPDPQDLAMPNRYVDHARIRP